MMDDFLLEDMIEPHPGGNIPRLLDRNQASMVFRTCSWRNGNGLMPLVIKTKPTTTRNIDIFTTSQPSIMKEFNLQHKVWKDPPSQVSVPRPLRVLHPQEQA
jgi:hypothetical protein